MGFASNAFGLSVSEAIAIPILVAVMVPFGLPAFMLPVAIVVSAGFFALGVSARRATHARQSAVTIGDYFNRLSTEEFGSLIRQYDDDLRENQRIDRRPAARKITLKR